MTASDFRAALAELGLTAYSAGPVLGISKRQSYRYSAGRAPVPEPVTLLLRCLLWQMQARARWKEALDRNVYLKRLAGR